MNKQDELEKLKEEKEYSKEVDRIFKNFYINHREDILFTNAVSLGKKVGGEENKLFNTEELDKKWVESFYEDEWDVNTLNLTKFEKEIVEELGTFLPRHMPVYDWNLPYAEMTILIIRNLLKNIKIITGNEK